MVLLKKVILPLELGRRCMKYYSNRFCATDREETRPLVSCLGKSG
jgi:hypothetical protein